MNKGIISYEALGKLNKEVEDRIAELKRLKENFYTKNDGSKINVTIKGLYKRNFKISDSLLTLTMEFGDLQALNAEIGSLEQYSKNITEILAD